MFRTFDSDNSGKIDFKEFLLAINITSAGKPEQKLEWAFQMYDVNGDGTIEPSEMCEIITVNNTDFIGSFSSRNHDQPSILYNTRTQANSPTTYRLRPTSTYSIELSISHAQACAFIV